jgi:hypothetical protein
MLALAYISGDAIKKRDFLNFVIFVATKVVPGGSQNINSSNVIFVAHWH